MAIDPGVPNATGSGSIPLLARPASGLVATGLGAARPRRMVFMTGGAFTEKARTFLEDRGAPVLEKPFDGEALRRILADLLRNPPEASA